MTLPATAATFGDLLKYLRRRARLTQRELALAVGYTEAHICRLEKNQRPPDLATLAALFGPALYLEDAPELMAQLLQLATTARGRGERPPTSIRLDHITIQEEVEEELGALEDIPALPPYHVERETLLVRVRNLLSAEKRVALCGMAGAGKTAIAATIAREQAQTLPVFWLTLTEGVTTTIDAIIRQLALFLLTQGQAQLRPLAQHRPDAGPAPSLDQQVTLIGAALSQRPALLCLDDVHLVREDAAVTSLLRHLIASTPAALLLMSREDVPLPHIANVRLTGLEHAQALQLIEQVDPRLKPPLADRLVVKTGGSPMLLRLAAGQMRHRDIDRAEFIEHLETQPQVAAYLLDRVLRDLSSSARWLAALISVFRQPIDLYDETLVELIQESNGPRRLDRPIDELQRRQLIDHAREATLHPLVRDHIYATLSSERARKKQLHRLAAEWSELIKGDIVEAAHHYCRAGDVARVVEAIADQTDLLFNAGQARAAAEVVDEALAQLQRKRGDTTVLRRRLLTARGDLLRSTLRAGEAEASYREALALAHGIPAARAQIAGSLGHTLLQRGKSAEALQLVQSAAADLSAADTILLARLAALECRAYLPQSRYDEAERTARRAIALTDQFAEYMPQIADDVRARAERTLGWVAYTRQPEDPQALTHFRRALEATRRAGLRVIEAATLSNIGVALVERGQLDDGLRNYEEGLAVAESLGDSYSAAATLHNISLIYYLRGQLETALQGLEQVCDIERRIGDLNGLLSSENARADTLVALGRLDEARTVLDRVLADNQVTGDTWTLGSCWCTLAEVQLLQGELALARATAQHLLAMPGIDDNARIHTGAECCLALTSIAAGDPSAAQQIMQGKPPTGLGLDLGLKRELVVAIIALAAGDGATAKAAAQSAADRAQATGYHVYGRAARRLLRAIDHPPAVAELPRLLYFAAPAAGSAG